MRAFVEIILTVALVLPGCYGPHAVDCVLACGEHGSCPHDMTCSNGFCSSGRVCEMPATLTCNDCAPGTAGGVRCRANVVLACTEHDGWTEQETCAGDRPVCLGGMCRQCRPGSSRCATGCLEPCDAEGAWVRPGDCLLCAAPPDEAKLAAGWAHTCALRDGRVKCWGDNYFGQLGLGDRFDRGDDEGEMGDALPFVDLGRGRMAIMIAAGGRHTCALLDTGDVKCWGDNSHGQLGIGDTMNRGDDGDEMGDQLVGADLAPHRTTVAITAGGAHTCALLDDGSVKCWGDNTLAQLGVGDTEARGDGPCEMGIDLPAVDLGSARATAVVAGSYHTCALLTGGRVRCWGNNERGELGVGDLRTRGGSSDAPPAEIDFGAGRTMVALVAGQAHTCSLDGAGRAVCWGENGAGQLGLEDHIGREAPSTAADDRARDVHLEQPILGLAAGAFHSCAILGDGHVRCWGLATFGELGSGATENRGDDAGEMFDALAAVDLGQGGTLGARALAAGGDHTCALLEDDRIKCWGLNQHGQLGLGDRRTRGDLPGEMGEALPAVPIDLGSGAP